MKPSSILAALLAILASGACEKKAPAPSALAPDASAQTVASAVPPVDSAALREACEEQIAVRRAAEDQYYGTRLVRSVTPAREAAACITQASLPGSGLTPEAIRACARAEQELATRSIALWARRSEYCVVRGRLGRGTSCSVDSQCASAHCVIPRGALCGTCGAPVPSTAGQRCVVDRCGAGLHCSSGVCVPPVPLGGACNGRNICSEGGSCVREKCVAPARKGERCDENAAVGAEGKAPACEARLDCGPQGTCIERKPQGGRKRKLTQSCEKTGDHCEEGYCKRREDEAVCEPFKADGMSCDPDEDACLPPAICSRAAHRCELRGAYTCGG